MFDRGRKLLTENRDRDWNADDCKDVAALFVQNKKRNKDVTFHPLMPGRKMVNLSLPGQHFRKEAYFVDPVSKGKVTATQARKLFLQKCGPGAAPVTKPPGLPQPGGVPLTPIDDKVLAELDRQNEQRTVIEKQEQEAKAQKEAEAKQSAITVGALSLAGLLVAGYVLYRVYG
jgi:hypothetical protein